jgi:hypothetical protein
LKYELIREIFNHCSGNQMRDVNISEVECADVDAYVRGFFAGKDVQCAKTEQAGGVIIYDIDIDGLVQRLSFTPC